MIGSATRATLKRESNHPARDAPWDHFRTGMGGASYVLIYQ
jgi:hypothetical protein